MLRKLSGTVCAVCTVLYGLSLAADYLGGGGDCYTVKRLCTALCFGIKIA